MTPGWLLTLALAAPVPPGPLHDGLVEYVTRPGDTCAAIASRYYGDATRWDLIHRQNPQLGEVLPHQLKPGQRLHLPPPQATAEVTAAVNRVEARAPDRPEWRLAQVGLDLWRGWRVMTAAQSGAEVTFRNDAIVQMRDETLLIVFGTWGTLARRPSTRAVLDRGTLRTRMAELAGQPATPEPDALQVEMPVARARVPGSAVVAVDARQSTRVSHHEGAPAELASTGSRARLRLEAGYGSQVARGARPTPPRALLPPPVWSDAVPTVLYVPAGRPGVLRAAWAAVPAATAYRVEVSLRADGRQPYAAVTVPATIDRFEIRGVPPGTHYARVATIDDGLFEGRPSPARGLVVAEVRLVGPDGGELAATGDGAPRVLPGSRVAGPPGVECRGPDGEAVLVRPGRHAVRCGPPGGALHPAVEVDVVPLHVTALAADGDAPGRLTRGEPARLRVRLSADLPLASTWRLGFGPGVTLDLADPGRAPGLYTVVATAAPDAGTSAILQVATPDGAHVVGTAELPVEARPPAPVEAPPARTPANEALVRLHLAPLAGLRDERRAGDAATLALAPVAPFDPDGGGVRLAAGGEAGLLDGALFLRAGAAFEVGTGRDPDAVGGDRDLTVGALVPLRREDDLGLAVDLEVGAPLGDAGSPSWRALPSLHLSSRPLERLVLRMRQGALIQAARDDAGQFWASAYGVDFAPAPWLVLGAELALSVGPRTRQGVTHQALAGTLGLHFEAFEATLGPVFSLGDFDPWIGAQSMAATLRVGF